MATQKEIRNTGEKQIRKDSASEKGAIGSHGKQYPVQEKGGTEEQREKQDKQQ